MPSSLLRRYRPLNSLPSFEVEPVVPPGLTRWQPTRPRGLPGSSRVAAGRRPRKQPTWVVPGQHRVAGASYAIRARAWDLERITPQDGKSLSLPCFWRSGRVRYAVEAAAKRGNGAVCGILDMPTQRSSAYVPDRAGAPRPPRRSQRRSWCRRLP